MADLDVLICTYERPDHVLDAVRDALAQLRPGDGLLVLDQSLRVQATRDALTALGDARVRHVAAPPRGLPIARNRALALTERPLVVFLDDDVRLEPGCLEAHRDGLEGEGIGATVGAIEEPGEPWNARRTRAEIDATGRVRVRLEGPEPVDVGSVKGCNMGFRREVLDAIGGFDPGYGGTALLEEADVSERVRRAGWRIRYLPDAALVHLAAPSGGVRVGSSEDTERWRFHNTGRFVARHRRVALPLVAVTFAGIAARRALEWRDPRAPLALLGAFGRGVASVVGTAKGGAPRSQA